MESLSGHISFSTKQLVCQKMAVYTTSKTYRCCKCAVLQLLRHKLHSCCCRIAVNNSVFNAMQNAFDFVVWPYIVYRKRMCFRVTKTQLIAAFSTILKNSLSCFTSSRPYTERKHLCSKMSI